MITDPIQQCQQILQRPVAAVDLATAGEYQTVSGSVYQVVAHGDGSRVNRVGGDTSFIEPGESRILDGIAVIATIPVAGSDDVHSLVLFDPSGYPVLATTSLVEPAPA